MTRSLDRRDNLRWLPQHEWTTRTNSKRIEGIGTSGRQDRSRMGASTDGGAADSTVRRPHDRFIVECPACAGVGRVVRQGSQVPVSCRLCWERGRVSRIAARAFLEENQVRELNTADEAANIADKGD